jgi:hypothetical protein
VDADWDQKLQQTMVEMFPLKTADAAYGKISGMVSTLGDPFTKIISPKVPMYQQRCALSGFRLVFTNAEWDATSQPDAWFMRCRNTRAS